MKTLTCRVVLVRMLLPIVADLGSAWSLSLNPIPPIAQSPVSAVVRSTSRTGRRTFVTSALIYSAAVVVPTIASAAPAERAVGAAEVACRQAGNCLERGDFDGAVGWNWGARDRCDASDPLCGTDGQLRETALVGKAVPAIPRANSEDTIRFTHIAAIVIEVGRDGEVGVLKLGLYGNEAPGAVQELAAFLSATGFVASQAQSQQSMGAIQPAVSLQTGGVLTNIVPQRAVEFGVPSQANAYARKLGRPKAGDSFVPQPRPPVSIVTGDSVVRSHNCAGLVSIPEKGLGYGGTGFESEDECYEAAFLITADSQASLDKGKRRVVGQVLDAESMAFLERLANIPTKRGMRGVVPGQTSGPPLPKVVVRQVQLEKVASV